MLHKQYNQWELIDRHQRLGVIEWSKWACKNFELNRFISKQEQHLICENGFTCGD